ncbi:unnamed protein product [Brachionus calyciflorus]|uniref:Uncharacterized protein n=1 Tax=Brachionus calyciflorus TaxID=104777 RepID=A0A813MA74_9BILA|nr:unnamed protein product [Brachionus calyciflorus]
MSCYPLIFNQRFKLLSLFNSRTTGQYVRSFRVTPTRQGLSDPFRPNKSNSNKDLQDFIAQKEASKQNISNIKVKDDNFLGRLAQKILNPTPLNLKFRQKFFLNEDYRMVYLIENERLFLILQNAINLIFPVFFFFVGVFAIAELTGNSQMSKSFEDPYLFVSFLTIWFSFAYFMAKKVQSVTIFRIYYNQKEDKFALIRMKGLFKFEKEDFVRQNVVLRSEVDNQNQLVKNLTKNFGNVYINNKLRQIDFKMISSQDVVQKMLGKKNYQILKNKSVF